MFDPLFSLLVGATAVTLTAFLFWPDKGLYWRWQQTRRLSQRVLREDALKHIHKADARGERPSLETVAGSLNISCNEAAQLLAAMQEEGSLQIVDGRIQLTPPGRETALHIIRAHRLWEHHLAQETGVAELAWHGEADRFEHLLSATELETLAAQLGNPTHDPHGDPIPSASGEYRAHGGQPLNTFPVDQPARIVHIEDEPEVVYAQIAAAGLTPGMTVRVVESSPQRVRFWVNGDEHVLAPMLAANISVVALATAVAPAVTPTHTLANLGPGEVAEVVSISPKCRGLERRRFMDLGILRGTQITAEFRSPNQDPVAYRIRGALIALRQEQAQLIKIRKASP